MPFSSGQNDLLKLNPDDFDFNIQFEQLFFSIIPSVLFIITSLWRSFSQVRKPTVVNAPVFQLMKLGTIATYVGLELSLLILVAAGSFRVTGIFVASCVLKLVSALFMVALSLFDHSKSPRPSVLLNSYLFMTLLLDITQTRTLFLSSDDPAEITYSSLFSAAIALKVGILLLEAQRKSKWVVWNDKEHSPEETSGIFSLGIFFWLNKLFLDGYRKVLTLQDLYPLDNALKGEELHAAFAQNMDYSKLKGTKYGLLSVLTRTLDMHILSPILPRLALLGFTFCQPLFIEQLVDHLANGKVTGNVGYGLIGASIFIYSGIAISSALYWYLQRRMQTMARSILVTEIFHKATRARMGGDDNGAALTLMSTDIDRIDNGFMSMHDIWASSVQVAIGSYMLYRQLGPVFAASIGVSVISFGGLVVLMQFTGQAQKVWMDGIQRRVGLTATVIAGMKNLKVSGLAPVVGDFVQQLRTKEIASGSRFRKILVVTAVFGFCPLLLSPPLTFALTKRTLTTTRIFTSLSYLLLVTNPLSEIFQITPQLFSGLACLHRIQLYLECEDRNDYRQVKSDAMTSDITLNTEKESPSEIDAVSADPVVIESGSFGWSPGSYALREVNTRLSRSSLTLVVGPVGSGKSTLCKAILGEIPFSSGRTTLSTRLPHIGFCDQTPFLSNASIKANIVGFSPFDSARYAEVMQATALSFDVGSLADGDETNVGSDGITLSGGQKQRVSLARALYLHSDFLVLDDVFSGLDADTEQHVFRQVFGPTGLLRRRGSTVILCTHSVRHASAADHIIVLDRGTVVEQGTFDHLSKGKGYISRLGLKEHSNVFAPPKEETIGDSPGTALSSPAPKPPETLVAESQNMRQVGDKRVYKHYLQSMGYFVAASGLFFSALWGFFTNFPTIWLEFWSHSVESQYPAHSYAYYAGLYAFLQACALISLVFVAISIFVVANMRAGAKMHHDALRTLIAAPLHFLTTTDTGVVTNLFSQDLNLIDQDLPNALLNTMLGVFETIGQASVMLTTSSYMALSYPFLIVLLYVVQRFYLRTSRQLRLLDLETKSPLYTHFLDTLKGIATLRAFGFMPDDLLKNAHLLNSSQRPTYLLAMIQQWLALVLGLTVMVMATVLTTLAVRMNSNAGFAGASLVTVMTFGSTLAQIVAQYTKVETSIGAIARLKAFSDSVKSEDRDGENFVPPDHWPANGAICLRSVSASYETNYDATNLGRLALRDINLTIKPGEKLAICGRTGSGKSSLVALLLKLLDPTPDTADNVSIDDTPLSCVNRAALRQRILAMPQDAVFLPDGSTFQSNLDPSGVSSDKECEAALDAVGMWQFVRDKGGLHAGMTVASLSAGQRQLMSLGRTILRRRVRARTLDIASKAFERGILLLDEVSSNVDRETERVMQEIIRTEFQNYTVVAVSHRLDMIMDFDTVVVMHTGEIVEVGNPMVLAGKPGTRFADLIKARDD